MIAGPLVMVHSPLVGAMTWQPVAEILRSQGHDVRVPSLAAAVSGRGPYYTKIAKAVSEVAEGKPLVTLVVHSGAGSLVPVIAQRMQKACPYPLWSVVFVDAQLPIPKPRSAAPDAWVEGLRGLAVDGILPRWDQWFPPGAFESLIPEPAMRAAFIANCPNLPFAYFEERPPMRLSWVPQSVAYIRLSAMYDAHLQEARANRWRAIKADLDHLAPLTRPAEVAALITQALTA